MIFLLLINVHKQKHHRLPSSYFWDSVNLLICYFALEGKEKDFYAGKCPHEKPYYRFVSKSVFVEISCCCCWQFTFRQKRDHTPAKSEGNTEKERELERERVRLSVREQKSHSISHFTLETKLKANWYTLFGCPLMLFDEENNHAARYFNLFGIFVIHYQIETMWNLNANPPHSPWIPIHRIIIRPKKCHNQKAFYSSFQSIRFAY